MGFAMPEYEIPNEKTADELFEELGYGKEEENILFVHYTNLKSIFFNKCNKVFLKEDDGKFSPITMQELKAINKKCEELGWL